MNESKQIEKALFDAAVNLSETAREAFLDQACHGNSILRTRIEALLAVQEPAEEFFKTHRLEANGFDESSADRKTTLLAGNFVQKSDEVSFEGPNTRIGRYKLLRRLGEGGCGVVYLAEQEEPMRRRVALKIIRLGMDTESVIARFEAERQSLALMDHPNIAVVLDAGATGMGRPYFVMELVRGVKITDYCNNHHLDTRQRLDLFIQICHAIQHAHQKGIIHRDIKPSNILVALHDGAPVPKVIDFGIAKATRGRLTDNTFFTACDQFIGTPAYMSPEQAEMSGLDIDTRSDIYSLGVLLYELLTGRTPFDTKELLQSGVDEIRRTLREREPQPPSTLLTTLNRTELKTVAAQRRAEPPRLILSLRGDLDWIVMKALEKDRSRRYETANGLAMDVQRYLSNEPVVARPPSQLYRLQKLVRRNKMTFIAGAAVTAALLIALGTSTWLFFKERELHRQAERSRENEALLRQHAETREKIAQAMILIEQDRFEEADRMVTGIPLSETALVGAAVFRPLGDRAAVQGLWRRAAECLSMLVRVDRFEPSEVSTLDYTKCAVALIELGDHDAYENYRRDAIKHFAGTADPVVAERTIKNSLLLPANANMLASLSPLADLAAHSMSEETTGVDSWMMPWRSLSLALMEYRRGDYASAVNWCNRCLSYKNDNASRTATIRAILAMSQHRLGEVENARANLEQSRELIDAKFKEGFDLANTRGGYWFDWVLGQILLREASAMMGEPDAREIADKSSGVN